MGWEKRARGEGYYVRKVREGKQVRSEYLGKNDVGDLLARFDRADRREAQRGRAMVRQERQEWEAWYAPVVVFCADVEAMQRLVLTASGYHRPKRGEWRKQRMSKPERAPTEEAQESAPLSTQEILRRAQRVVEKATTQVDAARSVAAIREQLQAGASKHPEVCKALYAILDQDGCDAAMVEHLTSTATQLLTLEPNLVLREAFTRQMQGVREELGWATASGLERLLIERIVVCGYTLHKAEMSLGQIMEQSTHPMAAGEYLEGKVDRVHKRYLAAVKALAEVRKLKLPNVQVNIGDKQINVVQNAPAEPLR